MIPTPMLIIPERPTHESLTSMLTRSATMCKRTASERWKGMGGSSGKRILSGNSVLRHKDPARGRGIREGDDVSGEQQVRMRG